MRRGRVRLSTGPCDDAGVQKLGQSVNTLLTSSQARPSCMRDWYRQLSCYVILTIDRCEPWQLIIGTCKPD